MTHSLPYHTLIPLFEELRGERVLVRPYREGDAQALFEAMNESRDHLRPWMPFADEHQTVDESRHWIIQQMAHWLLRDDLALSIWEQSTGRYLGGTGLYPHDWEIGYFEIGYWLRTSAEGYGYVTEAVRLLTNFALDSLKANRLEICCDELNTRSAAIPKRLGYVLEGRLRNHLATSDGRLRTTLVFSLIPTDRQ
ncbi:MAG TPA: GNAT family N-acetyltransferase [Ktedonobacteraceae bacterium]